MSHNNFKSSKDRMKVNKGESVYVSDFLFGEGGRFRLQITKYLVTESPEKL